MRCEHWAELVVAADDLDDAGLEDVLSELDGFEGGVWRVWAWLDDDRVTGEKSWDDFAEGEDDWEVPVLILVPANSPHRICITRTMGRSDEPD